MPRPDPTPSPSPTPLVQLAGAGRAASGETRATLAEQVVLANADRVTSATAAAAGGAAAFEKSVRRLAVAPVSAAAEWPAALASLAAAKHHYRAAEAAVFYVDPGSPEELAAQPDPCGAGAGAAAADAFAEIDRCVDRLSRLTAGGADETALGEVLETLPELAAWSSRLRTDLQAFAGAWDPAAAGGFRAKYFLASPPEHAVARIFQGLLAQSGDVLPRRWLDGPVVPAEVAGRTAALRDLYLGITEAHPEGRGLHDLVFAAAPAQAMATWGAIARAAALAEALALAPANPETRRQLRVALEETTRQLALSAGAVGIRIVELPE